MIGPNVGPAVMDRVSVVRIVAATYGTQKMGRRTEEGTRTEAGHRRPDLDKGTFQCQLAASRLHRSESSKNATDMSRTEQIDDSATCDAQKGSASCSREEPTNEESLDVLSCCDSSLECEEAEEADKVDWCSSIPIDGRGQSPFGQNQRDQEDTEDLPLREGRDDQGEQAETEYKQ